MDDIDIAEAVLAESLTERSLHERFLIDRAARESEIVAMLALSPFVRGDEPWMVKFRVDAEVAPLEILPDGAEIDRWVETSWSVSAAARWREATLFVETYSGGARVTITGPTRELVEEARAIVRERSPEPDLSDAVQVAFWRWGDHGAHETTRALDTPSWPEIRPELRERRARAARRAHEARGAHRWREAAPLARRARHRQDHRHPLAHP